MSTKGAWDLFRRIRVFIFVFCILLSLGCSAVFSIYASKNWNQYNVAQRVFMVSLAAGYGVVGVFLYLIMVVKFRVWLDAARVSIYLLLALSGAAFFSFVGRTYPCNLGSVAICSQLSMSLIIVTWTISGLLAAYACYLGIMSFIPQPPSPVENEGFSTDSVVPVVSKVSGAEAKGHALTPLSGTKIGKNPSPSISVSPPPSYYETASKPALFTQFPVLQEHRSPQFPPGLPRPLPLPNPFSSRPIERSASSSSSIPSSYTTYWRSQFQRSPTPSNQTSSYVSSRYPSIDISARSDRSASSRPRHPSLLTPATIPRGHFRPLPIPISSDFYRAPQTPRQYGMSLPRLATLPSYHDERQWANWHYPRYDGPRSASASVFSSHTIGW